MMNIFKRVSLLMLLLLCINVVQATTIRPFRNLGEMAKGTEAVLLVRAIENYEYQQGDLTNYRTSFTVLDVIKGELKPGQEIYIQHLRQKIGDLERQVWGDLEIEEGKNYLLFLDYHVNGYWLPKMLSYGAFIEDERYGNQLLVPIGMGREVEVLPTENGDEAEVLKVYQKNALIEMLSRVVNGAAEWNSKLVETNYRTSSFSQGAPRNAVNPGHCSHVSDNSNQPNPVARWNNFDSQSLPVHYYSAGDAGCPTAFTKIQGAISTMNTAYQGINLTDAGTHSYSPTCVNGAYGSEFLNWVNLNLGGYRHLVIQFDDPCNQIANLSGCNGTLAIGGLYWFSSTHNWNGQSWRNAALGYIVVNNGTGACQCSTTDYDIMITHEMSHALNIGHIAPGDGMANMNPSCCNTVQTLDVECLDYMYVEAALPVELIDFNGSKSQTSVELNWMTASEVNNDYFILERAADDGNFEAIAEIRGSGNSSLEKKYSYMDDTPVLGNNYYRLTQVDLDGNTEVFEKIVRVSFEGESYIQVVPNPVTSQSFQLVYQVEKEGEVEVEIFNITGQRIYAQRYNAYRAKNLFDLSHIDLNMGAYIIRTTQGNSVKSMKFVKSF